MKFSKTSLFLYLFFASFYLSAGTQSFAGGDPDEFAQEEEQITQNVIGIEQKKSTSDVQKDLKSSANISVISGSCLSFPEAIAYKEHFACLADIEKNRIARINWSFSKLLLR